MTVKVYTVPTGRYQLFNFYDYYPGGGLRDISRVFKTKQETEKFLLMDFNISAFSEVPGEAGSKYSSDWDAERRRLHNADHIQIYDTLTGVWIDTDPPYGWMGLEESFYEEDLPEEKYLREWVSRVMEQLPNA
ncbi:hypothetical protein Bp8pC_206 [Bacillus phage Bp8p-C]|uniref:Uncharacterized protein n=2 Tax=Agatevirus Bp8pC TaxID=1910937 RepID=A0A0A0PUY3_9CAUD|nr:hypothetical protein AXJ20_gp142 [Bacillus phage Bp8p-C]YP_009784506.1 hypothetical protein QLX39_gp142 [Bacillus phage Bp8p-T]AHJ87636.1 hypothetical protein Bp8pC_206 [Bacillus phage Bp8p-C]AHJ87847.1 hypothetical protein Bp8pT_206 [Bacillus phage Bp8p-T]